MLTKQRQIRKVSKIAYIPDIQSTQLDGPLHKEDIFKQ